MFPGYTGNILHINLSNCEFMIEKPDEKFYRKYIGGSTLGMYYLLKMCPPSIDPFAEENIIIFATGPLAGAPLPGSSRMCITTKSPLTGLAGDSQIGGYAPAELKFAGFDAIVIIGKSSHPVYVYINNGSVEIKEASHLWGMGSVQVEKRIMEEVNDFKVQIFEIGVAGEKLSRIASVIHYGSRAAGRNGVGAVMGSKNLKAIAIRGTVKPKFFNLENIISLARFAPTQIKNNPSMKDLYLNGSNGSLESTYFMGGLPTRNYNEGNFEDGPNLFGSRITEKYLINRETCYACSIHCKRVVEVKEGPFRVDPNYGGAEYESVAAFGSYCGVNNIEAVELANQYCNEYGLDTISTGATIAFAMECYENGYIPDELLDGLEIRFGNAEALISLVKKIGSREGIGNILAEGSQRASEALGSHTRPFLTTIKGQELPAHMPNYKKSLSLIYAVNPFGADHESSEHDTSYEEGTGPTFIRRLGQLGLHDPPKQGSLGPEKVRFVVQTQRFFSILDTVPLCHFCFAPWTMYDPNHIEEAVNSATGWDINMYELMTVGERRINMMKAFNAREGATRDLDTLPEKCFIPLKGTGRLAGTHIDRREWQNMKDLYYQMCGWDIISGNPLDAKYYELGLSWIIEEKKPRSTFD